MIDLTEDQLLGMARIAGLHIPDEDVVPLTLRLNALLEASAALDQFPLEDVLALPTLPHPAALPVHQRDRTGKTNACIYLFHLRHPVSAQ